MSISAGTKLGHYAIRSKIGEGGMGEVYLAQDTRLDRKVAIFSFGCILYEAVTGQKAFAGKDTIDSLNKIIREPVALISDFRSDAPNHLQRIVRRCLAKRPTENLKALRVRIKTAN